jgi:hypothetical protein
MNKIIFFIKIQENKIFELTTKLSNITNFGLSTTFFSIETLTFCENLIRYAQHSS